MKASTGASCISQFPRMPAQMATEIGGLGEYWHDACQLCSCIDVPNSLHSWTSWLFITHNTFTDLDLWWLVVCGVVTWELAPGSNFATERFCSCVWYMCVWTFFSVWPKLLLWLRFYVFPPAPHLSWRSILQCSSKLTWFLSSLVELRSPNHSGMPISFFIGIAAWYCMLVCGGLNSPTSVRSLTSPVSINSVFLLRCWHWITCFRGQRLCKFNSIKQSKSRTDAN